MAIAAGGAGGVSGRTSSDWKEKNVYIDKDNRDIIFRLKVPVLEEFSFGEQVVATQAWYAHNNAKMPQEKTRVNEKKGTWQIQKGRGMKRERKNKLTMPCKKLTTQHRGNTHIRQERFKILEGSWQISGHDLHVGPTVC